MHSKFKYIESTSQQIQQRTRYVKFLEYHRFYKTKYLVDSFYIFLCPLTELVTLSLSMPSAIHMPGVAGRYSATESNADLAEYLPVCV